jgi:hypothetical protein
MPIAQPSDREKTPNGGKMDVSQFPSSPGDSPVVQTPKDVQPGDAAARDVTQRNLNADNPAERQEALLDEASELSFPASDPIAVPVVPLISEVTEKTDAAPEAGSKRNVPPQSPASDRRP